MPVLPPPPPPPDRTTKKLNPPQPKTKPKVQTVLESINDRINMVVEKANEAERLANETEMLAKNLREKADEARAAANDAKDNLAWAQLQLDTNWDLLHEQGLVEVDVDDDTADTTSPTVPPWRAGR